MEQQSMSQGQIVIYQQLQKGFRAIAQQNAILQSEIEKSKTIAAALTNLAEQYRCCSIAQNVPLYADFPDMKAALLYKIQIAMDNQITTLNNVITELAVCSGAINLHLQSCMDAYQRQKQTILVTDLCRGSPHWPSISHLLQWLESAATQFEYQKHQIEELNPMDEEIMNDFLPSWKNYDKLIHTIQEPMAHASFLMEDSL